VSCGVTADVAADADPVPTLFVAATVNVYAVPSVNPVTTADDADPLTCTVACACEPTYGVIV
jgi:hypothetical protein